ncbi:MAG: O-methyltransferase family 3 [Verrucomicrobiales bacterium]|nr:O-methyltransferase family 3 [Verrucomicrobiales bacterium]
MAGLRVPLHSNIALEEALTLYKVIREIKPRASAEVGLAQGISTLAILQGLADNALGVHHVMDPFQDQFENAGLSMVERAGLRERICFHRKFPEEVFPHLPPLQFVFVDASHLFDLTMLEFVLADKKIELNGVIAFHDMWMPSLRKVVRYILQNRSYSIYRPSSLNVPIVPTGIKLKAIISKILQKIPFAGSILR